MTEAEMTETGAERPGAGRAGAAARLRAFGAFWYDFVIGDDWVLAAGVVIGLAGTYLLSRAHDPAWWLLPVVVAVLLPVSLWRATRRRG